MEPMEIHQKYYLEKFLECPKKPLEELFKESLEESIKKPLDEFFFW